MTLVYILIGLQLKHFIVDFPLQVPYMYKNKGTFGHPGGFLHAGLHGLATGIVFAIFLNPIIAVAFGLTDFIIHYLVDWGKMNLNRILGWGPTTHEQFWWLLGFDQFLHQATYILFIFLLV